MDDLLPCPFCGSHGILHEEALSGHKPVECSNSKCCMRFMWPDVKQWQHRAEIADRASADFYNPAID